MVGGADWETIYSRVRRVARSGPRVSADFLNVSPHFSFLAKRTIFQMQVLIFNKSLSDSDAHNALRPLVPHALSISPTGHVLLTLDTHVHAGKGGGGRDLLVWGANGTYELGNGKRTSLAVPTNLEKRDGSRVMLMTRNMKVTDLQGGAWGKTDVEQCAVGGYGNTVVYWKILR